MSALIAADSVTVLAAGRRVLDAVSLSIAPGEIVTVVGPNGGGKTTLLRVLTGLRRPDQGSVARKPGLRLGYAPQRLGLDPAMPLSVDRFLALAGGDGAARRAALNRTGVAELATAQVTALSGGEMQRVLVARALLRKPDLLILDEPTQGMDQPGEAAFYRLISEVRDETGAGVLMVSHDLHVVMSASDRVLCLNGHVCCVGAPDFVSESPEYRRLFGRGTRGALALYRHEHDHGHDHPHDHTHSHGNQGGDAA